MNQKNLGIVIFTIIETFAVVVWRVFVMQARQVFGIIVLLVGFIAEHFKAYQTLVGPNAPKKRLFGMSGTETIIWIVHLIVFNFNPLLGISFFTVSMFFQHSVELNIFRGKSLFENIFKPEIIGFTLIESAGANGFLYLFNQELYVAATAVLFFAFLFEHVRQSKV